MSKEENDVIEFDFTVTEAQDITAEEFEAFDKKSEGGNYFNDPGSYELEVVEIINNGPQDSDPNWIGVNIILQDINERQIKKWVAVPTCNLNYRAKSGKDTGFMYSQYKKFLLALGIPEVNHSNVLTFGKALFQQEKIVGMKVQATLGYEGAYAKYLDTDKYGLMHNGELVVGVDKDDEGEFKPWSAADKEAVEAHATSMGISDFCGFISLLVYEDCPDPKQAAKLGKGKKSTKVKPKKKPKPVVEAAEEDEEEEEEEVPPEPKKTKKKPAKKKPEPEEEDDDSDAGW